MSVSGTSDTLAAIIEKAKELGASLAGVASVAALRESKSYSVYEKSPYYAGRATHAI
jgi:hypothetical protein